MSMSERDKAGSAPHYRKVTAFFPDVHPSTAKRWAKEGKIRKPDLVVNGCGLWRDDLPLAPPDDGRRKKNDRPRPRGVSFPKGVSQTHLRMKKKAAQESG